MHVGVTKNQQATSASAHGKAQGARSPGAASRRLADPQRKVRGRGRGSRGPAGPLFTTSPRVALDTFISIMCGFVRSNHRKLLCV